MKVKMNTDKDSNDNNINVTNSKSVKFSILKVK